MGARVRRTILRQRAWGARILERLDAIDAPSELTRHVRAFRAAQSALDAATRKAQTARERRDGALDGVARVDGALERAVIGLGRRLVSSGLGTRKNPLGTRSSFSPSQISQLEHAAEVAEVLRLVERFKGVRVPPPVRKALAACATAARSLERARLRVQTAQRTYSRAIDARDLLLGAWTTALARLQRRAGELLVDEPETLMHVFAAPGEDDEPRNVLDLRPPLPLVMNGVHTT